MNNRYRIVTNYLVRLGFIPGRRKQGVMTIQRNQLVVCATTMTLLLVISFSSEASGLAITSFQQGQFSQRIHPSSMQI